MKMNLLWKALALCMTLLLVLSMWACNGSGNNASGDGSGDADDVASQVTSTESGTVGIYTETETETTLDDDENETGNSDRANTTYDTVGIFDYSTYVIHSERDENGRIAKQTFTPALSLLQGLDVLPMELIYVYNSDGTLAEMKMLCQSVIDREDSSTFFEYQDSKMTSAKHIVNGVWTVGDIWFVEYHDNGMLKKVGYEDRTVSEIYRAQSYWAYDANGRLISLCSGGDMFTISYEGDSDIATKVENEKKGFVLTPTYTDGKITDMTATCESYVAEMEDGTNVMRIEYAGDLIVKTTTESVDDKTKMEYTAEYNEHDLMTRAIGSYYEDDEVVESAELTYTYGENKKIIYASFVEKDVLGNAKSQAYVVNTYNEKGLLLSTKYSEDANFESGWNIAEYTYDEQNRAVNYYSASYDALGNVDYCYGYAYEYNDAGLVVKYEDINYDENGNETSRDVTEYEYDGNGLKTKATAVYAEADSWRDYAKAEDSYQYNDDGYVIRNEYVMYDQADIAISKYVYKYELNNANDLIKYTDAQFDSNGLTEKTVDEYERNAAGDVIKETFSKYSADSQPTSKEINEYDDEGTKVKCTQESYEDGQIISKKIIEYDAEGNRIKETNTDYDANGEMTEMTVSEFKRGTDGNLIKSTTTYYDADGMYQKAERDYDKDGNNTKTIYYDYEDGKMVEKSVYDKVYGTHGNLIKSTTTYYDADGMYQKAENDYDKDGNNTKTIYYDYEDGKMVERSVYDRTYDAEGYCIRKILNRYDGKGNWNLKAVWDYKRYANGDLQKEIQTEYYTDGTIKVWTEIYDENGEMIEEHFSSYDANGNLIYAW